MKLMFIFKIPKLGNLSGLLKIRNDCMGEGIGLEGISNEICWVLV